MTTPPSLPTLPGLSWSRHKKPGMNTRIASHVSGREVRAQLMANPLYEFELQYNGGLTTSSSAALAGLLAQSLQTLLGFHLQVGGQFGTFLYVDPHDNAVTAQFLGNGDGSTTAFQFVRPIGGFVEPVGWVTAITNVYLNGSVQAGGSYSLTAPNTLTFNSAPGNGVAVTSDFSFAFNCRFLDDQLDFEEIMSDIWKIGSVKFRSVKSWLGG